MLRTNRPTFLLLCLLLYSFVCFSDLAAQVIEQKAKGGTQEPATQTVIAEGVGASADEAIKGAFRAAVQQVVGAVVDAETMVKDDTIINNSVLTYSDGFIKEFTEIPGSKTVNSGVHRIRIKAMVERKALVAKLKAANVSMIPIDGQGLFAEVTSQLQSEADASALLAKHLKDFPGSCLKISVLGKPETVTKSAEDTTFKFKVKVEPDLMAYKAFRTKLIAILEKTAKPIGETTVLFQELKFPEVDMPIMQSISPIHTIFPAAFLNKEGHVPVLKKDFFVCVETSRTKKSDRVDYRIFKLELSLAEVVKNAMEKLGEARLRLIDVEGEIIASSVLAFSGRVGCVFVKPWNVYEIPKEYQLETGFKSFKHGAICMIASVPCMKQEHSSSDSVFVKQVPALVLEALIKLSHDELRAVKNAKAELTYPDS